jgi:hypothetical protein
LRPAYDKLIPALKNLLPKERLDLLGRIVGFIRRLRAIEASAFIWSVVLSRLGSGRPGFEQARDWFAQLTHREIFPRPFQMRFKNAEAVTLFASAFEEAVAQWRRGGRRPHHRLARDFTDVIAIDATLMQLNDRLEGLFGGLRTAAASLKVVLSISIFGLVPVAAQIRRGRDNDQQCFPELSVFRRGALLLFDKGFVSYRRLRELHSAGLRYLCPMRKNGNARIIAIAKAPRRIRRALVNNPSGVLLRDVLGAKQKLKRSWDVTVVVQSRNDDENVICRLIIAVGPRHEQRPYLTNIDDAWTGSQLAELYRLRWQIELVFKELKQDLSLGKLPSKDPHAVQVFAWASLLALALSRTIACWLYPLPKQLGLQSEIRLALVTRALRSTVTLLVCALLEQSRTLQTLFFQQTWQLAQAPSGRRADSLARLS